MFKVMMLMVAMATSFNGADAPKTPVFTKSKACACQDCKCTDCKCCANCGSCCKGGSCADCCCCKGK